MEDGRRTLRGNPAHPYSQGELCPKVNHFLDRVYSPDRVLHPLVRVGPKGEGRFERASWDDVLALIGSRVGAAIATHGGETVLPWSSAGNQSLLSIGQLSLPFFTGSARPHRLALRRHRPSGHRPRVRDGRGIDPTDLRHSRFIILWGTNTRVTNRHLWPFVRSPGNGATVVVIDPVRTTTARSADWFVQPLPGTDAALAMAMMHVIVRDGLVDTDYVERHASGVDDLRERSPSGLPNGRRGVRIAAEEIERLARAYGSTRPAAIRMLIGAEHREQGGDCSRRRLPPGVDRCLAQPRRWVRPFGGRLDLGRGRRDGGYGRRSRRPVSGCADQHEPSRAGTHRLDRRHR